MSSYKAIDHLDEASAALAREDYEAMLRELSKALALIFESGDLEVDTFATDDIPHRLNDVADSLVDFGPRA